MKKKKESSHNLGVILLEKKDEGGALRAFLKAAEQVHKSKYFFRLFCKDVETGLCSCSV
jgi:hypothetical protein